MPASCERSLNSFKLTVVLANMGRENNPLRAYPYMPVDLNGQKNYFLIFSSGGSLRADFTDIYLKSVRRVSWRQHALLSVS